MRPSRNSVPLLTRPPPEAKPRRRAERCWFSWRQPTSPASGGRSSSTTRSSGRGRSARPESADAAVLDLPEAGIAIAVAIDGNGRRVACDPYAGTIEAVLECAQNLACVGAEPLGLTNCLNFGNPEKPAVAWQLDRAVQGLADVCNELGMPVVGGNVSLYNETDRGPIYPTPVVGLVGELPDPARAGGLALSAGDAIALVGPFAPVARRVGARQASRRARPGPPRRRDRRAGGRPRPRPLGDPLRAASRAAHDVSDGGVATALAEMAIAGGVGAEVELDPLVEARDAPGRPRCSARGPAASCSPAIAPRSRRWRRSRRRRLLRDRRRGGRRADRGLGG